MVSVATKYVFPLGPWFLKVIISIGLRLLMHLAKTESMPSYYLLFVFQDISRKIKDLSDQKNVTEVDKQQVMDEKGELIKSKTKLELDIRDLEEGVSDDVNTRVQF